MKQKRNLKPLMIILMVLFGIGLFAYPTVSNFIFAKNASTMTEEYDELVNQASEETLQLAWNEAVSYNEALTGNPVKDPFLEGSGMAMAENYAQVLNLSGNGAMGYVSIPKIGVRLSIYHGTDEQTLQKGIGHLEGSSLPIGGIGSHSVLTGHTGLVNAKIFTDLIKLKEGDLFYLHLLGRPLAYEVDQIKVVLPDDTDALARIADGDYCTLVTCTPYGVNSHRLLVRGARTEYIPEEEEAQAAASSPAAQWFSGRNMLIGLGAGGGFALAVIIISAFWRRWKRKRRRYWWDEIEIPKKEAENPAKEDWSNPWQW